MGVVLQTIQAVLGKPCFLHPNKRWGTGARRPGENGACHHDGKISLEAEADVATHAMTVAVAACPG